MAKPPAGSSLLFGALADSGQIKQRKNGSYRMVLDGVDEIDWFTDRPNRVEGTWKPQKLIRQWDSLFETSGPNAQASFKVGEKRELMTFEMFEPKFNNKKQRLSFKIDAGIINNRESDLVTGLKGKALDEVTLFIDDATLGASSPDSWVEGAIKSLIKNPPWKGGEWELVGANLSNVDLSGANLSNADLKDADLTSADLSGANLSNAFLSSANLSSATYDSATIWPTAEYKWGDTICPDGTNGDNNPSCGF